LVGSLLPSGPLLGFWRKPGNATTLLDGSAGAGAACLRRRPAEPGRLAALFGVDETTLYRWQQQARIEGRREAKPHAGGPAPRLRGAVLDTLRALVLEANALTLAEYGDHLAERVGVRVSVPTLCRTLKQLGLVRKKPSAPRSRTASPDEAA
jgi:transposase